jgi:RNA recognition motif-containing protein
MQIYISNVAYSVSEQDLIKVFSRYGRVNSARLVRDRESDSAMGFGFVEMENQNEANNAIGYLNGSLLCQRTLVVNATRGLQVANVDV